MGLFRQKIKVDAEDFNRLISEVRRSEEIYREVLARVEVLERKNASLQGQFNRRIGVEKNSGSDDIDPEMKKFLESTIEYQELMKNLNRQGS